MTKKLKSLGKRSGSAEKAPQLTNRSTPRQLIDPETGYELTESEALLFPSKDEGPAKIAFKQGPDGYPIPDHQSVAVGRALILHTLGITDQTLYDGIVLQLWTLSGRSKNSVSLMNLILGCARSIVPRDQLEAMLAIQMAATHVTGIQFLSLAGTTNNLDQRATYERTAIKLMGVFASQMEALRKRRNGGSQKVYVKHVHVHDGGQAIVGNVPRGDYE